jgi:pimeloyl-ACP methyl ester carboxylesterase
MNAFAHNATAVLVHGAWEDGSCWSNVVLPLQRRRLKVICAPLPLTSLSDDAAALSRVLERTSGAVILAAHAYGGAVIATTRADRVQALVYIAALAPDEGETVAKVFYRDESHPKAPKLSPDKHGFLWMPEEGFDQAVAHQASTEQKNILAAVQRPLALRCIQEPAPAPAWKVKPSWYLLAEEDRMINPKTQRFMAERMRASVQSERVDHTPMLSAPELVIDLILEAARETSRPEALAG